LLSNIQLFLKKASQIYFNNKLKISTLEKTNDTKNKQDAKNLREQNKQLLIYQNYWYAVLPDPYNEAYRQRYYFV